MSDAGGADGASDGRGAGDRCQVRVVQMVQVMNSQHAIGR